MRELIDDTIEDNRESRVSFGTEAEVKRYCMEIFDREKRRKTRTLALKNCLQSMPNDNTPKGKKEATVTPNKFLFFRL